ncbi:hypothetical protein GCM10027170_06740 [Aliiglaciecola aliphaticivorans]
MRCSARVTYDKPAYNINVRNETVKRNTYYVGRFVISLMSRNLNAERYQDVSP